MAFENAIITEETVDQKRERLFADLASSRAELEKLLAPVRLPASAHSGLLTAIVTAGSTKAPMESANAPMYTAVVTATRSRDTTLPAYAVCCQPVFNWHDPGDAPPGAATSWKETELLLGISTINYELFASLKWASMTLTQIAKVIGPFCGVPVSFTELYLPNPDSKVATFVDRWKRATLCIKNRVQMINIWCSTAVKPEMRLTRSDCTGRVLWLMITQVDDVYQTKLEQHTRKHLALQKESAKRFKGLEGGVFKQPPLSASTIPAMTELQSRRTPSYPRPDYTETAASPPSPTTPPADSKYNESHPPPQDSKLSTDGLLKRKRPVAQQEEDEETLNTAAADASLLTDAVDAAIEKEKKSFRAAAATVSAGEATSVEDFYEKIQSILSRAPRPENRIWQVIPAVTEFKSVLPTSPYGTPCKLIALGLVAACDTVTESQIAAVDAHLFPSGPEWLERAGILPSCDVLLF